MSTHTWYAETCACMCSVHLHVFVCACVHKCASACLPHDGFLQRTNGRLIKSHLIDRSWIFVLSMV